MTLDEKMYMALEEAQAAYKEGETPVGAALFCGDSLLCSTHNRTEADKDPTAHAELLAIREGIRLLGGHLESCELYVTMEPCPMCTGAILNARVGSLVYGCSDPRAGCCGGALPLTDCLPVYPLKVMGGIRAKECAGLLTRFFRERRDIKKAER